MSALFKGFLLLFFCCFFSHLHSVYIEIKIAYLSLLLQCISLAFSLPNDPLWSSQNVITWFSVAPKPNGPASGLHKRLMSVTPLVVFHVFYYLLITRVCYFSCSFSFCRWIILAFANFRCLFSFIICPDSSPQWLTLLVVRRYLEIVNSIPLLWLSWSFFSLFTTVLK